MKVAIDWFRSTNKLERLWLMAKIEFKLRYYENRLGVFWALLKPIADIIVYYIAFDVILNQDIPNFVSFLFIALICWNFFVEGTNGTIQILKTKKYLYEYTNMNKIEIYLSTILSNTIGFVFNFFFFCIFYQYLDAGTLGLSWNALYMVPLFLNLILLTLAFSIILSNIFILANDITQIWLVITSITFWVSPILFKLEVFRNALPGLDYINPIAGIIINARKVMMHQSEPEWQLFIFDFGYAIFLLLVALLLLNKIGSKASEKL